MSIDTRGGCAVYSKLNSSCLPAPRCGCTGAVRYLGLGHVVVVIWSRSEVALRHILRNSHYQIEYMYATSHSLHQVPLSRFAGGAPAPEAALCGVQLCAIGSLYTCVGCAGATSLRAAGSIPAAPELGLPFSITLLKSLKHMGVASVRPALGRPRGTMT